MRRLVRRGAEDIKLSPKEYDILEQLAIHAGKVLTHKHLLREVWRDESVDPQYLRVYVRQLRQKVEADPSTPRHVLTEPASAIAWSRRQETARLRPLTRRETMAESENYKKGTEIRRKLMGEKYADAMNKSVYADPMMQKFGDYAREAVFGMLWTRPGLDLKTRALICVVSDTAQARWPELAIHLRMARNQGWTEDELSEALLHLGGYIGLPSVREALLTAKEVFEEMRHEK